MLVEKGAYCASEARTEAAVSPFLSIEEGCECVLSAAAHGRATALSMYLYSSMYPKMNWSNVGIVVVQMMV